MQSLINAHLLWKGSVLAGGPVLFPLFLCLTPLLPTTDPQHSRQENLFVHLTACFLWEGASGREFDVWVTDPQVMLLGGTWSDQFEAENLPGHTGNGCCWVGFHPCLSSYFLKNPLLKVFFFFLVQMDTLSWVYLQEHLNIPFSRFLPLQGKVVTFWCILWNFNEFIICWGEIDVCSNRREIFSSYYRNIV